MNNPAQFSVFPFRRQSLGYADIETLLDQLAPAAVVFNLQSRRVVMANSAATELSAYTRSELASLSLVDLFANLDDHLQHPDPAASNISLSQVLVRRNKTQVEVQISLTFLAGQNHWVLLTMTPLSSIDAHHAEAQRQEHLFEQLSRLALAPQQATLAEAQTLALQTATALTGASMVTLYQADAENLALNRLPDWGKRFPVELPAQDLMHLRKPHIWTPGKRSLCSLHRAARGDGCTYIATAPIGQPNALVGLLVLADTQSAPSPQLPALLTILAETFTNLLLQHAQITSLQAQITNQTRQLSTLQVASQASQDALLMLNPDLTIATINPAAETALGYFSREVQGQPIHKILIGSEDLEPALETARSGYPTLFQQNVHLYRRSGQGFQAQVSTVPVSSDCELLSILVLIRDLSEKEQIQHHTEQLEQHALLGEVTAVFAHEVRNPINNISTGLQLMALNLPANDPNQEVLARLQQDCDRLEELMKSVLAFSRPVEYQMEPVDLGQLTRRLLDRLEPRIIRSNVQYHHQHLPGTPLALGNSRALEQVFTNLITNALQAMSQKGGLLAVKVQAVESPDGRTYVDVSVADNGPGIPKELQERIFLPFFTTSSSGTGLGLAITKRIVTAHKGNIQLSSFPGGSVFRVLIPAMAAAPQAG